MAEPWVAHARRRRRIGRDHVAGGHMSTWAPVWGATWQRVGRWRAHGIVGPGNKFRAVTQMRYRTPIFNRVISKYFFCVGLCSHTIHFCRLRGGRPDGYYVAYKPITLLSILFMFVEMKFIHCHSCVMFAMKSMSMCNE